MGLPPLLSEEQAKRIEEIDPDELYRTVRELLPEDEARSAWLRLLELQDHVGDLRRDEKIYEEYDQTTYDELRKHGSGSSYLARDAQAQGDLLFARWQFDNR